MNDDYCTTPFLDASSSIPESIASPSPAPTVSAEPSEAPEIVKLTPEPEKSLNPPSVSDAYLRSFASIYDSVVPVTESRDYLIFSEYANYSDSSLYLLDEGSSISANGTVSGSYTRYRIWSDYNGDSRYQVYYNQTSRLIFPALGDVRSGNVYSNVLGYRPNPYFAEFHHNRVSAVSSTMSFYVLAFASLLALIMGVLGKCLRK